MKQSVRLAVEKAAGEDGTVYQGAMILKDLLGCSVEFIYACLRKGWFPVDKARIVSDTYGIPLADLVKADIRAALNAQS